VVIDDEDSDGQRLTPFASIESGFTIRADYNSIIDGSHHSKE
jgi:hypothetical protein